MRQQTFRGGYRGIVNLRTAEHSGNRPDSLLFAKKSDTGMCRILIILLIDPILVSAL